MSMRITELLAEGLRLRRVKLAFCGPEGVRTPLADALSAAGIRLVRAASAASAAHMATAVGRVTSRPGIWIFGHPGEALQGVAALHEADCLRAPVVAVHAGSDALPDAALDLLRPACRRITQVSEGMGAMQVLTALASLNRTLPGPLLLDLPPVADDADAGESKADWGLRARQPAPADVSYAAELIRDSKRIVVFVGGDDRSVATANGIRRLVNAVGAATLQVPIALGAADATHPLYAGPLSRHPDVYPHQQSMVDEADLLIAVGLSPEQLPPQWQPAWSPELPVVSVDRFARAESLPGCVEDELVGPLMQTLDELRIAAVGPAPDDNPDAYLADSSWSIPRAVDTRQRWLHALARQSDPLVALTRAAWAAWAAAAPDSRVFVDLPARPALVHVVRADAPERVTVAFTPGSAIASATASRLAEPKVPVMVVTTVQRMVAAQGDLDASSPETLLVVVLQSDGVPNATLTGPVHVSTEGPRALRLAIEAAQDARGLHLIHARTSPT